MGQGPERVKPLGSHYEPWDAHIQDEAPKNKITDVVQPDSQRFQQGGLNLDEGWKKEEPKKEEKAIVEQ